jgi:hypothetical protein
MSRPKGKIQKRDEKKYWLPPGVVFLNDLGNVNYRKETPVLFLDSVFGEFISTFKAIQNAEASTHPEAIINRRKATNVEKYGQENAGATPESRNKAKQTMLERYGVEHALQNVDILKKSQETLKNNYGVKTPMESNKIKKKQRKTFRDKYGTNNPMKVPSIKEKLKQTFLSKYGVDNPSKNSSVVEKILKTKTLNQETGTSNAEKEIAQFINGLGLCTKKAYIGGKNPKELDILIPEKNIAIEHNGCYYHSELFVPNNYHFYKMQACKEKNMRLIQIFDYEWQNRKAQVKSFLKSALGKNEKRVFARKCEIRSVEKNEANFFLDSYHILGKVKHKNAYGLYYNNELVSLITLGLHHRGLNQVILNRYITAEGITVVGGLSRLCKHALSNHGKIYTWVDLRYSTGENWEKIGWFKVAQLKPDYFYFDSKKSKVVSKQSRKKNIVNTPKHMTEHEHALEEKLYRVYDCGKIKFCYHP